MWERVMMFLVSSFVLIRRIIERVICIIMSLE